MLKRQASLWWQSADGGAGFVGELGSRWYNGKELEDGAGERGLV